MKRFLALEAVLLTLAVLTVPAKQPSDHDRWTIRWSLERAGHECRNQRYNPDGQTGPGTAEAPAFHWRLRLSIEPALPTPNQETMDR